MQAGIPHEKGREKRQILQGDDTGVWNNYLHSKLWGWSKSPQTGIPMSLCPAGVLVLPLSHDHSQTHTDVLHQQCIFPPKHLLLQSLSPCSTSVSGDFISLNSYESSVMLSNLSHSPWHAASLNADFSTSFSSISLSSPHALSSLGIPPAPLSQMPSANSHFTPLVLLLKDHRLGTSSLSLNQLKEFYERTEKYLCYRMRSMLQDDLQ